MQELKRILSQKLKNAEKVAFLGIGSDLRGDDVAGISAVEQTEKLVKSRTGELLNKKKVRDKSRTSSVQAAFFIGATAPENLTGEIKKFQPSHLIIIDSVYSKAQPGGIIVMEPGEIGEVSFFTHKLPIKLMIDYLLQSCKCTVLIVGIQPKNIEFGAAVSKEVNGAVKELSETLAEILCGAGE